MFAIRDGDWKLVLGNGSGGRQQPRGKAFEKPYFLANIKTHGDEQENFAEAEPLSRNDSRKFFKKSTKTSVANSKA